MSELQRRLDAEDAIENAKVSLIIALGKLYQEGPSIPLWDAVHAAENKVANLEARQEGTK